MIRMATTMKSGLCPIGPRSWSHHAYPSPHLKQPHLPPHLLPLFFFHASSPPQRIICRFIGIGGMVTY